MMFSHGSQMRHYFWLGLAAASLLALVGLLEAERAPGSAAAASAPQCVVPAELTRIDVPLQRTARQLASGELLVIVALGSSSTAGAGASPAGAAHPRPPAARPL